MGLENWKDIPNYIGYYQVSNKGNVRSLDRYELITVKDYLKERLSHSRNIPMATIKLH